MNSLAFILETNQDIIIILSGLIACVLVLASFFVFVVKALRS